MADPDRERISDKEYARSNRRRWTLRELGQRLRRNPKTISRKLNGKSARSGLSRPNPERSIEAGLAWHALTGELPTSYKWNVSLCLESSPVNYARCLRGWASRDEARRSEVPVERWPSPAAIAREFASFPEFCEELREEVRSRAKNGNEYEPAPIPEEQVVNAERQAAFIRDLDKEDPEYKTSKKGVHVRFLADHPDLSMDVVGDGLRPVLGENRGMLFQARKVMEGRRSVAIVGNSRDSLDEDLAAILSGDLVEAAGPVVLIESPRREISRRLDRQFELLEILVYPHHEFADVDLRGPGPGQVAVLRSDDPKIRAFVVQAFEDAVGDDLDMAASLFVSEAKPNLLDLSILLHELRKHDYVATTFAWQPAHDFDSFCAMTEAHALVVGHMDSEESFYITEAAKFYLDHQARKKEDQLLTVGVVNSPSMNWVQLLRESTNLTTRDVDPDSIPCQDLRPLLRFPDPG